MIWVPRLKEAFGAEEQTDRKVWIQIRRVQEKERIEVLLSAEQIDKRMAELADELYQEFGDEQWSWFVP